MKKVLFTAHVDSHILQFHLPYLKMFKEHGYEVHVATNGNEEIPYCDVKHVVSFERSPFKINNLRAIKQLRKIIDEEKFDIIHTHTPMGAAVTRLAAKKARKRFKTRVIYTAHGFHFFKGASKKNWLIFYPVEKWLAKYTDTLITINKEDYDLAKSKFSKRCKDIQLVPGVGVDENKFNVVLDEKEKKELRKSIGLKSSDFVIIYPAELSNRKRQMWLINSIKDYLYKYKDVRLLLPGKDSLNGQCQKLVRDLHLENQVLFLGYRKDIPKLLRISNLSISTANQEGLPVNIMEAMYYGLNIVVTDCRGNRDLIKNNYNGFIVGRDDSVNFIKSIDKFHKGFKNNFKENNFNDVKKYSLSNIIPYMEKIYFRKKKVLHILPSNIYSGAENVICSIIENLGDQYDMFYCSPKGQICNILKEKNINYISINKFTMRNIKKIISDSNPDIVHAHDFKSSFICSLIKNNKLVIHLHNNVPWLKKICINSFLFLFSCLKADKVLIVSNSIRDEFIFSKFVYKKMVVVDNPLDKNEILSKANINSKKEYDICCIARLNDQKKPLRFFNIVKKLSKLNPNLKVVWVGDGELRKNVEDYIMQNDLTGFVTLTGFQKNPFLYLSKSKVFVLTSAYEGFGLVAFEALTFGLPCVVSNVGGLPNLVDDSCGKLCNNDDDFTNEIEKLLKNKKYYEQKARCAINKSDNLSNIERYMSSIVENYED